MTYSLELEFAVEFPDFVRETIAGVIMRTLSLSLSLSHTHTHTNTHTL